MDLYSEISLLADSSQIMKAAGMTPDPWQENVLLRAPDRLLLNCCRQSGKTHTIAAMAVSEMLRAESLVLAVCPAERQSKFLIQAASKIYSCIAPLPEQQSTTHLMLPNGSEMWALPGKEQNIRGFSKVALVIIDEASRVPDALYHAVRPMLAVSGGRIAMLSTPWGKRGFFHKEWTEGVGWERVRITAHECPRITPEYLEEERRSMPDAFFRQEYMCEFTEEIDAVFKHDDIMAAFNDEYVAPLFPVQRAEPEEYVAPLFARVG